MLHQVPVILRQKLLSKCLSDLMEDYTPFILFYSERNFVPVYILNMMLDENIKELRLNLCCFGPCSHKNALFKAIANYGNGLNSLDLTNFSNLHLGKKKQYFI